MFAYSSVFTDYYYYSLTESSSCSADSEKTKSKSKDKSRRDHQVSRDHKYEDSEKMDCKDDKGHGDHSESDVNDTDVTKDSEEDSESDDSTSSKIKISKSVHTSQAEKKVDSVSSSSFVKPTSTSSCATSSPSSSFLTLPRFSSETSIVKTQAAERKMKARSLQEPLSSEGESDPEEDIVSSELENSDDDDELNVECDRPNLRKEIVTFFQTATKDELTLIVGCSIKKAQRIVELRPFDTWESLVRDLCFSLCFTREDRNLKHNIVMLLLFITDCLSFKKKIKLDRAIVADRNVPNKHMEYTYSTHYSEIL